jgi:hypothetical protein
MKKKHLAEDLPSRPHPQASLSSQSRPGDSGRQDRGRYDRKSSGGQEDSSEKKVRQAVYDIKYRARRENVPLRTAYSQYMQNSSMSEQEKSQVRDKLFGGEGGSGGERREPGMRAENFQMEMKDFASQSMMNALYKVFVEKNDNISEAQLKRELEEANLGKDSQKKYKVRVTDPKSEVTYVRYATREKINELRAKGLEVEMTEYGKPYEEGEGGENAKKDYDGDGKIESSGKEHAGAVHNAIQRKKGGIPNGKDTSSVKESYFHEVSTFANLPQMDSPEYVNPNANQQQIDLATRKNKVTVNPDEKTTKSNTYNNAIMSHHVPVGTMIAENGYSRFLNLLQEKKMTAAKKKKEKNLKKKYDESKMKKSMQKQYGPEEGKRIYFASIRKQAMKEASECGCDDGKREEEMSKCMDDKRSLPTSKSLIKSKFQSMGIKNPDVMIISQEPQK